MSTSHRPTVIFIWSCACHRYLPPATDVSYRWQVFGVLWCDCASYLFVYSAFTTQLHRLCFFFLSLRFIFPLHFHTTPHYNVLLPYCCPVVGCYAGWSLVLFLPVVVPITTMPFLSVGSPVPKKRVFSYSAVTDLPQKACQFA